MKFATKGFTLIEVMIVIAIVGILTAVAIPAIYGTQSNVQVKTMPRDYRCIAGFKFTRNGKTQIINSENGGIHCDELR